ncbi:MAG: 50S ribosomal protein L25 [bacterium]|nr:50S ribosomal protein L25 [Candidatus Sumerlaeota bacterium]
MNRISVSAVLRTQSGKGPNRRLRVMGRVPAVLYGTGMEPLKLSLDTHDFNKMMAVEGGNALLSINIAGTASVAIDDNVAIVREVQRDPVTRRTLHVDLYRIRMDVENNFEVPIHSTGMPVGVREGGILETHLYTVEVRCLPTLLPSTIEIDIVGLKINNSIHVSDLKMPDGVKPVSDPETVVFTVLPPKIEAEAVPTAAEVEEVQQPEVITKKKAEEAEQASE